jgi:hypothetical protein
MLEMEAVAYSRQPQTSSKAKEDEDSNEATRQPLARWRFTFFVAPACRN